MKIAMKGKPNAAKFSPPTETELRLRRDLAACYRLAALFGWDDLLATHISVRIPSTAGEEAFLINPFGLMFEEITASSLVKVNIDGEILQDTPYAVNRAGFVIHSAVHHARADAQCVMHLHTRDTAAVSATKDGVLPLNQTSMLVAPQVAFHDYEGIAVDTAERERIAADLGSRPMMLLRNHGALSIGDSVAHAFYLMYMLEWSCSTQVRTLAMGLPLHSADPQAVAKTGVVLEEKADVVRFSDKYLWPALLRKLDRTNPGYAD